MKSVRRSQREKLSRQRQLREQYKNRLCSLFASAAMACGVLVSGTTLAQTRATETEVAVSYSNYREFQVGESRMRINAPQLWVKSPVWNGGEIEASGVVDSMSGASPNYLDTVSGASGLGIKDQREAGDLKYTHYFDGFNVSAGINGSDENDYRAKGGLVESLFWSDDKNTIGAIGFSGSSDSISSSNDDALSESRRTYGYLVGVTQVIDSTSIVQSNLTLSSGDGYFSDQYKPFDKRPRSRDSVAWLTRYNSYFEELKGALHADYRFYHDSWSVDSHTVELAWYQEIGTDWVVRPNIRYYTQGHSDFYSGTFPPENFDAYFSADQRVSDFGSLSFGLKATYALADGWDMSALFEFIEQRQSLRAGGVVGDPIEPFGAYYMMFGLSKHFSLAG